MSFLIVSSLAPSPALAATYTATTSNAKVSLSPGEKKQVTLSFKNTGTGTWTAGKDKTALYIFGKSSIFGHPAWLRDDEPGLIKQTTVKSGQTATATFWVQAPYEPGVYHQKFLLSYGPNAWVKGSTADIEFTVKGQTTVATQTAQAKPATTAPVTTPATQTLGDSSAWKAELVDRGGLEWQLGPQDHTTITLSFKNIGTSTWTSSGKNYVSLYTGKDNRKSGFKDFSWKSDVQTVTLKEASVRPNEIGHFVLELRAPEVPGSYQESFQLAAEDAAWIGGGTVSLPIKVSMPNDYIAKGIPNGMNSSLIQPSQTGNYKGVLLLSSAKDVTLLGNGRINLTYGIKNTGTATWNNISLRLSNVSQLATTNISSKLLSVRDESWVAGNEPVRSTNITAPGQIGFVGFTLKAPPKKGKYTAKFSLYVDNQPVTDADINIPITVTADGYIEPDPVPVKAPVTTSPPASQNNQPTVNPPTSVVPLGGDVSSLPNEPIIRVGLFKTTDDQMVVRAVTGGFNLLQNGTTVCSFNFGDSVAVNYDRTNKVYKAAGPGCNVQSTGIYVAVAPDGLTPLEMTDFYRPVSWLPGANDNKFRGKLELRYTPATDAVWVINELPIEWYLKGMAETSNSSPQEYQRALMTAARTYAMYHVQRGTKHANENYIVDATYDQVYRGYGAEIRDGNVVTAIDATRGQIVTYQEKLAITPYYSRSDGRTRSWSEVWGGSYPWLIGVPVPWDQGKTLWGHGVGMSATGALGMAADGWTYDRMLKYFYTGIELRQIYK